MTILETIKNRMTARGYRFVPDGDFVDLKWIDGGGRTRRAEPCGQWFEGGMDTDQRNASRIELTELLPDRFAVLVAADHVLRRRPGFRANFGERIVFDLNGHGQWEAISESEGNSMILSADLLFGMIERGIEFIEA